MVTLSREWPFKEVVLVADIVANSSEPLSHRRDLEQTDRETIRAVTDAISVLGFKTTHYERPDELGRNAAKHTDSVVLSIYGGKCSRNRMALVPAICEAYGLRFIGPDTYGRIIAQDKEVTKRLARECGLLTPSWRVIRSDTDLSAIDALGFPVVAKPLLEGSSIGVTQHNLLRDAQQAELVVRNLLQQFRQPVLLETFVRGRETGVCAIDDRDGMHWGYAEVIVEGQPNFFLDQLFDVNEKQNRTNGRTVKNIDSQLASEDLNNIRRLLEAVKPWGYCRVDGRHVDGRFHFLELTPDAWIHPNGQFAMAFTDKGWTYVEVIGAVLASAN